MVIVHQFLVKTSEVMADDDFADGTHIAEGHAFGGACHAESDLSQSRCQRPPKTRSGRNRQGGSLLHRKRDRSYRSIRYSSQDSVQLFRFALLCQLLKACEMMKEFDKAGFLGTANSIQYPVRSCEPGWRWLAVPG